jgi:hypothetical protein
VSVASNVAGETRLSQSVAELSVKKGIALKEIHNYSDPRVMLQGPVMSESFKAPDGLPLISRSHTEGADGRQSGNHHENTTARILTASPSR